MLKRSPRGDNPSGRLGRSLTVTPRGALDLGDYHDTMAPTVKGTAGTEDTPDTEDTGGTASGTQEPSHSPDRSVPAIPVPPTGTLAEAGELLRALAAPVRIAIVLQLRSGERCVHELVDGLGVAQPLISQHLRVLKAARVVRGQRRGREVVYQLADDHLAHIVADAVAHVAEMEEDQRP